MTDATQTHEIKVRYYSETTDDRRNKRYSRKMRVSITVPASMSQEGLPYPTENFPITRYQDALARLTPQPELAECGFGSRGSAEETFYLHYTFTAERPSEILSEDECIAKLDTDSGSPVSFATQIRTVIRETHKHHEEVRRTALIQSQVGTLGAWVGKAADEEARKVVRFKQRLAALVAELEAEQRVQLEAVVAEDGALDKALAEHAEEDQGAFEPQAVALIRKVAERYLPSASPTGFLRCADSRHKVQLEEIEL